MSNGLNTLQSLTDTAIDSAIGYEKAADQATNAGLSQTLRNEASKRRQVVGALNSEIARLGGETRSDGTFSGGAHRVWTDITTAFGDKNESAAERVEEGEDYIEAKFREALDDASFQPETRQVIQQAHAQICQGERLTDRLEGQFE